MAPEQQTRTVAACVVDGYQVVPLFGINRSATPLLHQR